MLSRVLRSLSTALAVLVLCGGLLVAQASEDGWGYALAHELMSPFCPGRTLAACTSPQAAELRQWILVQEAAGATREQVEAQLLARYGDVLRSAPVAQGWGLYAYALPAGAGVVGVALVFLVLRRIVRPSRATEVAQSTKPPALARDEEAELEKLVEEELRGA